jgi:two-component system sensor histidine kinase TctE
MDAPGRSWAARLRARLGALAARTHKSRLVPAAMKSGLQRRLLLLLLIPLGIFALVSIFFDYQTAGNVALQKDQQLAAADSPVGRLGGGARPRSRGGAEPLLLLAPAVDDFLKGRTGSTGFRLSDAEGEFLAGESLDARAAAGHARHRVPQPGIPTA